MIAIVDYKAGNLTSVQLGFESIGAETVVTDNPEVITRAERVVFPGVGAAGAAMERIRESGLDTALRSVIAAGTPFLGICLGTQVLLTQSDEDNGTDCLGLIDGQVKRFTPGARFEKVPHMGWNTVHVRIPHPLFYGIDDNSEFYFVHSYYCDPAAPEAVLGETTYAGRTFASAVYRDNLVATQFHPEKSGRVGLALLENFVRWNGEAPTC